MKQIIYLMAASAMFLAIACQKNEFQDSTSHDGADNLKTLTVGVTEGPDTRVGFDENNAFYWHKGDRIGVITVAGFKEMVLDEQYHRQPSGVFTGNFAEDMGDYVVYPYGGHVLEDGVLTYTIPSSYSYVSIEEDGNSFNPPMYGLIEGNGAELKHLTSFFKINVMNIPAGGDDMKFIFTADRRLTGDFIVDLTEDTPVISTDDSNGNTVIINFSNTVPGNNGTFYVPAPLGTYGTITAEVLDGDATLVSKTWSEQTVSRMTPKRGTVGVEYVAEIDGKIYKSLQAAIDASDGQTITVVKDIDLDSPLTVASGKTVVLNLNGKTVSDISTSASTSYLLSVKSGADVTIRNGTLSFAATTPDTSWGGDGLPDYPGYANNTVRNEGKLTIENADVAPVMNLTVNGGTLTSIDQTYNQAVYSYSYGNDMKNVLINVSGGIFNGDIALTGGANKTNLETLNISGGTFNGAWGFYSYGDDAKSLDAITLTGGTFLEDPSDYVADGYQAVLTDGLWSVLPIE